MLSQCGEPERVCQAGAMPEEAITHFDDLFMIVRLQDDLVISTVQDKPLSMFFATGNIMDVMVIQILR